MCVTSIGRGFWHVSGLMADPFIYGGCYRNLRGWLLLNGYMLAESRIGPEHSPHYSRFVWNGGEE